MYRPAYLHWTMGLVLNKLHKLDLLLTQKDSNTPELKVLKRSIGSTLSHFPRRVQTWSIFARWKGLTLANNCKQVRRPKGDHLCNPNCLCKNRWNQWGVLTRLSGMCISFISRYWNGLASMSSIYWTKDVASASVLHWLKYHFYPLSNLKLNNCYSDCGPNCNGWSHWLTSLVRNPWKRTFITFRWTSWAYVSLTSTSSRKGGILICPCDVGSSPADSLSGNGRQEQKVM